MCWVTFVNKKATHFDDVLFYKVSGKNAVFYTQVVYTTRFAADLRLRVQFFLKFWLKWFLRDEDGLSQDPL